MDLNAEAAKLNTLFKMFDVLARASPEPLTIMWKTREQHPPHGKCTMVHLARFETVDAWIADAHRRIAEKQTA